jgi:UTP--glucose-1-phosphate uridylyltransferase
MIKKCLFPAAGYGTRFLPATKAIPKEMLPIITKPLLQYGVEEALTAGITNMAIVTGRGKRSIEDHFDNSYELESQLNGTSKEYYLKEINELIERATFTYIRQSKMLGLGDAIYTGKPLIGNEPFAVILADDLFDNENESATSQLIEVYKKYKCSIVAVQEVPKNKTSQYGIIDAGLIQGSKNLFKVNSMVEKPLSINAPSNLAVIGRYILTPDIFDILKNLNPGINNEVQLTDALNLQAKEGRVIALKLNGTRFDCGNIRGYIDATNHFANKI